jgi:tripartite-type tricarboxylate transporter receptor subunit TctC
MRLFKQTVLTVTTWVLVSAMTGTVLAQDFPSKPIKIIVPFAPGGSADLYARALALRLQESLKQNVIVDNRVGGGAVIGTDAAAKSPADGYTLLMMSNTQTVNETLIPNRPYQLMRDFVAVAPVNYADLLLVVNPAIPATNLKELLALAKTQPGKLNYASSGPGTPYHMAGELFKAMSSTFIVHVPYRGSAGARTDVIGGQVEMMFDAIPTMIELVKSGKVRALATTGLTRSSVLPDVPTVNEAGIKGYEATLWLGILAPKGTPPAIVAKLNAEITKITAVPELRASWAKSGATAMSMTPLEFEKYLISDIAKWQRIVKFSGAKAD